MARNTYAVDEQLESPFNPAHLKRSLHYIRRYTKEMVISLALSVLASIIGLFGPVLIQKALDEAVPAGDVRQLLLLTGLLVGTIVISILFIVIRARLMAKVGQSLIYDIRNDLFRHLQELPFS